MFSVIRNGLAVMNDEVAQISHNIANASTIGYKRVERQYQDIYSQQSAELITAGHGSRVLDLRRDSEQGEFLDTGSSLDIAINGAGLFVLQGQGTQVETDRFYSRNGSMYLQENGLLTNADGLAYLSVSGDPIFLPLQAVNQSGQNILMDRLLISKEGLVQAYYGDEEKNIAHIAIARFRDESKLQPSGITLFSKTMRSGEPNIGFANQDGRGAIFQSALEASSVEISEELVNLIRAQQAFSGVSKMFQTQADVIGRFVK